MFCGAGCMNHTKAILSQLTMLTNGFVNQVLDCNVSSKEHDAFCEVLHDGQSLPVVGVVNAETGAQRIIFPGKITVPDDITQLVV